MGGVRVKVLIVADGARGEGVGIDVVGYCHGVHDKCSMLHAN